MKEIYVIGNGGQARVVESSLKLLKLKYKNITKIFKNINDKDVELKIRSKRNKIYLHIAIGDNLIRKRIYDFFKKKNYTFFSIVDITANIRSVIKKNYGIYIAAHSFVGPKVKIGENCIINTRSLIEHDCTIKKHTSINPGAILLGSCAIDEKVTIGAKSILRENIKVGKNSFIGMGSVVIKNCDKNKMYFGNPAKLIKKIKNIN